MAQSDAGQIHIPALPEAQHIRPAGLGFQGGVSHTAAGNGQILHIPNHQAVAVIRFLPGVGIPCRLFLTVVRRLCQVVASGFQTDLRIRGNGCQKFIHSLDTDHISLGLGLGGILIGFLALHGTGDQTHGNKDDGQHTGQADPKTGLFILQHG